MSFHISNLGEFFVTIRTLERFHPVVTKRVSLQTVQSDEAFGALCAEIWTISCV